LSVRAPRLFHPGPLAEGAEVALDPVAAAHAVRVLRLAPGAPLVLFDGGGGEYQATLVAATRRGAAARIGAHRAREAESPLEVTLAQGLARGERMDLVIQKAVELGVTALVPVATARSVVKLDAERGGQRAAHWAGVVRAACEQCGRNRLPAVDPPCSLDALLARPPAAGERRLVLDPEAPRRLRELPRPTGPVLLLVGPEGGLDGEEIGRAAAHGFERLSLGPRVLRTETAGLAALAALQALWGDLG
jgi:16S rRNA (uracil1498-N3)-methyltransferase